MVGFQAQAFESSRQNEAADFARSVFAVVAVGWFAVRLKLTVNVGALSAQCIFDAVAAGKIRRGDQQGRAGSRYAADLRENVQRIAVQVLEHLAEENDIKGSIVIGPVRSLDVKVVHQDGQWRPVAERSEFASYLWRAVPDVVATHLGVAFQLNQRGSKVMKGRTEFEQSLSRMRAGKQIQRLDVALQVRLKIRPAVFVAGNRSGERIGKGLVT